MMGTDKNQNCRIYIQSLTEGIQVIFPDFDLGDKFERGSAYKVEMKMVSDFLGGHLEPPDDARTPYLGNIFEQIYVEKSFHFFDLKPLGLGSGMFCPTIAPKGTLAKLRNEFTEAYQNIPKGSLESLFFLCKKYLSFVPINQTQNYINAFEFLKLRSAFAQCLHDFEVQKKTEKRELPFLMLCIDISGIQGFIYNIASSKASKSLKGRSFYLQLLMDSLIQRVLQDTHQKASISSSIGHTIYASGGKAYLLLPNLKNVKNAIEKLEKEVERKVYEENKERLYVLMDFVEFGYDKENKVMVTEYTKSKILTKKQQEIASLTQNIKRIKEKLKYRRNDLGKPLSDAGRTQLDKIIEADNAKIQALSGELEADLILIADLWVELGNKTAQKKFRKYQNLFFKKFDDFFESKDEDGFDTAEIGEQVDTGKKVCAVTGDLIKDANSELHSLTHQDDEKPHVWVTEDVKKQVELGKKLKDTTFYVTYNGQKRLSKNAQKHAINPINLGMFSYVRDNEDFVNEYLDTGNFYSIRRSLVRKINDTNFLDTLKGQDASYGFTFYGGNQQALKRKGMEEVEKDYEELTGITQEKEKGTGFHRLGILRMDVDGLGGLFADEMKKNDLQNFPAYAMVSAHLENFFAGYLNTIRNQKKYEEWVNILYSGGDDVFAIGRWDMILEFAQEIRNDFEAFTRGKPTLSAGIAMMGGKFPISKGADMAGSAEGKAKKFGEEKTNYISAKKNAICIFDEVVSWDEFEQIHQLKNYMMEWLQNPETQFSKSLVYKIFHFRDLKNKGLHDWKWLSAYQFARLEKVSKPKSRRSFEFLKDVFGNHKNVFSLKVDWEENCVNVSIKSERAIDIVCLASRWAELELHMKNKSN